MIYVCKYIQKNSIMRKCIFLDRDGVINKDRVDYVYKEEDFILLPGVAEALIDLKSNGYLLIIITNQSGIAKGIFTHEDVMEIHALVQKLCNNAIDDIYIAPYHESIHRSLSRKPGTLLFEKAIAKYEIDIASSWMIGDKERDLVPAKKLGLKTILVDNPKPSDYADFSVEGLKEAANQILKQ